MPVEDMRELGGAPTVEGEPRQSIWPAVYPRLLELVRAHTLDASCSSTTAARPSGSRNRLNELAEAEIARAHHGSIAREQRLEIEDMLKRGVLPALVATSSLELGIDMGAVDLVVQIESPKSVAAGLQRVGRAGHSVGRASRGRFFPKWRGDLLETAVVDAAHARGRDRAHARAPPAARRAGPAGGGADGDGRVAESPTCMRSCAAPTPTATSRAAQFEGVLDMLAGRYPSDEFAELRPRIVWDRTADIIRGRRRRPAAGR